MRLAATRTPSLCWDMPATAPHAELILALDDRVDALCAGPIETVCSGAFWSERFGERGARRITEDARYHVDHLKTALEFDDPSILRQYAVWLQGVLTQRGMCTLHLAEHFAALARSIRREALPGAHVAEEYLRAAIEALEYPAEPARSLQAAADQLTRAVLHRRRSQREPAAETARRDLAYLLSYLSDAVALHRPDLFEGYVRWIDGYFTRRGRGDGYLGELLQALDTALTAAGEPVGPAGRPLVRAALGALAEPAP